MFVFFSISPANRFHLFIYLFFLYMYFFFNLIFCGFTEIKLLFFFLYSEIIIYLRCGRINREFLQINIGTILSEKKKNVKKLKSGN